MEEKIDINKYYYPEDGFIRVQGFVVDLIINLCTIVLEKEPKTGFLLEYPNDVKKEYLEDGTLGKVDVEWEEYPPHIFMENTNDPGFMQSIITPTSVMAQQISNFFVEIKKQSIANGICEKID